LRSPEVTIIIRLSAAKLTASLSQERARISDPLGEKTVFTVPRSNLSKLKVSHAFAKCHN
jgi:hypothetical protein